MGLKKKEHLQQTLFFAFAVWPFQEWISVKTNVSLEIWEICFLLSNDELQSWLITLYSEPPCPTDQLSLVRDILLQLYKALVRLHL